ncbi:YetF domain-containing protein [Geosporobacter ferrireducens]|uniref:DUF421 domain-containing protein n=1 Tax=Geosporobacter ferrireducens TaxID=1424294 RepID=A0A1D8GPW3_9FIRM|nr:DUF421 domain-containing protein [Geosporobacter ferrireducens]AOT72913.1 hypothetical protein Gferi_27155 [Geosporobacter ferrireducens]MTI55319.1 DUF421 domain-containing protein [Geosporobacter ferrireducens]
MKVLIEVFLQTILAFFSIFFITRIIGRQQVAQLTLFDYINGITFGSIAATLATDLNQRTWHHIWGLFLFGALTYLMAYIRLKNRRISKIIQGEPVVVIKDGRILEKNLDRFSYTVDDLTHLLRKKDVFDIQSIEYGILETTGEISILKKAQNETVTAEDLNLKTKQEKLPTEIIVMGNILYENLMKRNITAKWLIDQLRMMNIKDIREVYYASIDANLRIYIDQFEDHFHNSEDITEEQKSIKKD